ncbi:MAG: glycosyltransferase family 9 protein [Victivallaceae bacterium]|nr:glycosyltransferase family 9 protein [Victivallaceae bacterium]
MKVLVVKTSSLGDVIHALQAVEILAEHLPDAKFDFLVSPAFADVAKRTPNLGKLILFDRKKFGAPLTMLPYSIGLIRQLRKEHYDLAIDYQGLMKSAIFAGFSGAKIVAGFAQPREFPAKFFYTKKIPVDNAAHALRRNLELTAALTGVPDYRILPFPPSPEARNKALALLEKNGIEHPHSEKIVVLVPGARWKSKAFPPKLFAASAKILNEQRPGCRFLLTGGPAEAQAAREVLAEAPDLKIVNLVGQTDIDTLIEVLRLASVVLCNDSGPMHIAAADGTPVAAFIGPTRAERTGPMPLHPEMAEVLSAHGECSGCLKRECPISQPPPCHAITPAIAATVLGELLDRNSAVHPVQRD